MWSRPHINDKLCALCGADVTQDDKVATCSQTKIWRRREWSLICPMCLALFSHCSHTPRAKCSHTVLTLPEPSVLALFSHSQSQVFSQCSRTVLTLPEPSVLALFSHSQSQVFSHCSRTVLRPSEPRFMTSPS